MSSPGDDFSFGSLPRYGRRRPPRREFTLLLIGLLAVVVIAVAIKAVAGGGSTPAAGASTPSAGSPDARPTTPARASGSPAGGALSPQLEKIMNLGLPVYCGGGNQPMVALTFDDGPGPYTQYTLDTLKAAGAKASFFLVGKLFSSTTNQHLSKEEARFGDVGDHSWSHFGLAGQPMSVLKQQVLRPKRTIQKYSGAHVIFFRPPWGSRDPQLDHYVRSLGMIEIMWTGDSRDSEGASADRIVKNIDQYLHPGWIILMHENRGTTKNALESILLAVQNAGLRPVTLSTLLTQDPPSVKQLKHGLAGCQT